MNTKTNTVKGMIAGMFLFAALAAVAVAAEPAQARALSSQVPSISKVQLQDIAPGIGALIAPDDATEEIPSASDRPIFDLEAREMLPYLPGLVRESDDPGQPEQTTDTTILERTTDTTIPEKTTDTIWKPAPSVAWRSRR